jgi:hypothetical protein
MYCINCQLVMAEKYPLQGHIHSPVDALGLFPFACCYKGGFCEYSRTSLCTACAFIFLAQMSSNRMVWSRNRCMFNLLRNYQSASEVVITFHVSSSSVGDFYLILMTITQPIPLSALSMVSLFNFWHCSKYHLIVICIFIFLMNNDVDQLSMCLFAIHISSLVKCLFNCWANF